LDVTLEVVRAFESLEVPYLLGGSLASSFYGIPRATHDADLVADLAIRHVRPLVAALKEAGLSRYAGNRFASHPASSSGW